MIACIIFSLSCITLCNILSRSPSLIITSIKFYKSNVRPIVNYHLLYVLQVKCYANLLFSFWTDGSLFIGISSIKLWRALDIKVHNWLGRLFCDEIKALTRKHLKISSTAIGGFIDEQIYCNKWTWKSSC